MSRTRQMIELSAPVVMREQRPERFTVTGFTCPDCHGNGWGWVDDPRDNPRGMHGDGWQKAACPTCGGTGTVAAEVTVRWQASEGKPKI